MSKPVPRRPHRLPLRRPRGLRCCAARSSVAAGALDARDLIAHCSRLGRARGGRSLRCNCGAGLRLLRVHTSSHALALTAAPPRAHLARPTLRTCSRLSPCARLRARLAVRLLAARAASTARAHHVLRRRDVLLPAMASVSAAPRAGLNAAAAAARAAAPAAGVASAAASAAGKGVILATPAGPPLVPTIPLVPNTATGGYKAATPQPARAALPPLPVFYHKKFRLHPHWRLRKVSRGAAAAGARRAGTHNTPPREAARSPPGLPRPSPPAGVQVGRLCALRGEDRAGVRSRAGGHLWRAVSGGIGGC